MKRDKAIRQIALQFWLGVKGRKRIPLLGHPEYEGTFEYATFALMCDYVMTALDEIENRKGEVGNASDIAVLRIASMLYAFSRRWQFQFAKRAFPSAWKVLHEELGCDVDGNILAFKDKKFEEEFDDYGKQEQTH